MYRTCFLLALAMVSVAGVNPKLLNTTLDRPEWSLIEEVPASPFRSHSW